MSGFILNEKSIERVHAELPVIGELQRTIQCLMPDFISSQYDPDSEIPVAAVCLNDSVETIFEIWHALHEYFSYRIECLENLEPPDEVSFAFYGRIYLDDTAMRLYSAAEHLANAVVCMLEISDAQLKNYENGRVSLQSKVGNFLVKEMATHSLTLCLSSLAKSSEWQKAIIYRNKVVHEQPPTISDSGIVYKRRKRWKLSTSGKSYELGIGGGDEAEYSLDQVLAFLQPSVYLFADALNSVTNYYISMLEKKGIKINTGKGIQVKVLE
jgi:hypothetical protein